MATARETARKRRTAEKEAGQICSRICRLVNSRPRTYNPFDHEPKIKGKGFSETNSDADVEDDLVGLAVEGQTGMVLHRLVETWVEAGYKLEKWRLREWFQRKLGQRRFRIVTKADGLTLRILPLDRGTVPADIVYGRAEAVELFLQFITSPFYDRIHRCVRCGSFFFARSGHRGRKYCSARCAHAFHAQKAQQNQRREERKIKIERIRAAIRELELQPRAVQASRLRSRSWQKYITDFLRDVKPTFITRALTSGEIRPPKLTE